MPTSRARPPTQTTCWRRPPGASLNWGRGPRGVSSELVQGQCERGFAVGRLVLLNHALARGLVQLTAGRPRQFGGLVLVAGLGSLTKRADRRVKRRLHRLVAQPAALIGAIALHLRLDVGHA